MQSHNIIICRDYENNNTRRCSSLLITTRAWRVLTEPIATHTAIRVHIIYNIVYDIYMYLYLCTYQPRYRYRCYVNFFVVMFVRVAAMTATLSLSRKYISIIIIIIFVLLKCRHLNAYSAIFLGAFMSSASRF